MDVALNDWLATVQEDYLASYIPSGGAALKCLVAAEPETLTMLKDELERMALGRGFHYSSIDAAATRIHMIEQLFHAIARQIDWDNLAYGFMRGLLQADGFVVPENRQKFTVASIADSNGTEEAEVRRRVRALLRNRVSEDYAMTQEFRTAMLILCQAQLETGKSEQEEAEAIKSWLRGELRLISALKAARIFQKIGRNNARDLFLSLAHWLRLVAKQGLVLALDISRYLQDRRRLEDDGGLFYSTSAVVDAYEVLRQFIDATDELEGCLITVLAPIAFLHDDKRGLLRYDALKLRIWDDVHDRYRANPLAGLVRLRVEPTQATG